MHLKIAAAAALSALVSEAAAAPPIEAYGELPGVRALDISPTGSRFAYLSREKGVDYFMVAEPGKGVIGGGPTGELKARNIFFANDKFAIVIASETTDSTIFRGKWENSAAFSFDIEKKKFATLLKGFDQLFPAQGGLGRVVGRVEGEDAVFMPAYIGECSNVGLGCENPEYGLLKARLNLNSATIVSRGTQNTVDWYVDEKGVILAREDYDADADQYRVFTGKNGALTKIYQEETALPEVSVAGVHPDGSGVIIAKSSDGDDYSLLSKLGYDGQISGPLFDTGGASIDGILTDENRVLIGVRYAGMRPTYAFFDQSLTADMEMLAGMYPDDVVYLNGWTKDLKTLVLGVEGGATAPAYFLFDRAKRQIAKLALSYPQINDSDINPVVTIEYKARDGLKIPSILTMPRGSTLGQSLPLIVIPHGGPEAYDSVGFDWMAQYFASRGYLVFQPNFRGSYGFGRAHREAGYGEWGGDSAVYEYWKKLIGDKGKDKAKIEAVSPANFAAKFKAPVLLIHGNDDTVVPVGQSVRMENALKDAGKQVTFVKQSKADHWLSTSETRLQTLRELDKFVTATIGTKQ